jgi:type 1 fimbria pilin
MIRSTAARAVLALTVFAVLALATAAPAIADDALPWQHATEEFLIDATARHDSASGDTNVAVNFGWGHYVTDRTEVGAVVNAIFASDTDGYGAGPLYRFNFLPIGCDAGGACKGNLLLTGSASALTGDLADQAAAVAATGIGVRWYTGPGSALNLIANATRAIAPGEEGGGGSNPLDSYSLTIGLSFGVPQSPTP